MDSAAIPPHSVDGIPDQPTTRVGFADPKQVYIGSMLDGLSLSNGPEVCLAEGSDTVKGTIENSVDNCNRDGTSRSRLRTWLRTIIIGRNPKRTFIRIVVLVATCFIVKEFVLLPIRIKGPSMLPTYRDGGINFVNRLAYVWSEPKRGDVVGIRLSNASFWPPSVMFMKRIVGLPGETLEFHQGHLLINGQILEEPYVKFRWDWETAPVTLESNQYYVVGDNRSMPEVLHEEGRPRRDRIVGRILLCNKSLFASSAQ
jgi:signal peptidase I